MLFYLFAFKIGIIHWVSADPEHSTKVKYIIYNDVIKN